MGHAAEQLDIQEIKHRINDLTTSGTPKLELAYSREVNDDAAHIKSIYLLASIMIVLQILDGILTGVGISLYGVEAEGNPLLKNLMDIMGAIPALAIAKLVAISIILALSEYAKTVRWLKTAMRCIIALYLIAAIIPWTFILLSA